MRTLLKQALVAMLFVVSVTGGGHGASLHHAFHDANHAAEQAIAEAEAGAQTSGAQRQDVAAQDDHGNPAPASEHEDSGTSCTFGHAHCCGSAILASDHAIAFSVAAVPRFDWHTAIPYGQKTAPPLRPPRSQA